MATKQKNPDMVAVDVDGTTWQVRSRALRSMQLLRLSRALAGDDPDPFEQVAALEQVGVLLLGEEQNGRLLDSLTVDGLTDAEAYSVAVQQLMEGAAPNS